MRPLIRKVYRYNLFLVLPILFVLMLTSYPHAQEPDKAGSQVEDPFNRINIAQIKKAKITKFSAKQIPQNAFSAKRFEKKKVEEKYDGGKPEKIHPVLSERIRNARGTEVESVLINFRDDFKVPRFPEPNLLERRSSATNKRVLERAGQLIEEIKQKRAGAYKEREREFERYDAKVLETFWLINGALVQMPLKRVRSLADREDVLYVEPQNAGEKPPQDGNPNNDVADGRGRIVSDPYFNLGLTSGWIGLLDTGMRFSHTQFTSPSHVDFRRDCVLGGANCNTGGGLDPTDDCWNHGTSSGAIITANANQGAAWRGVTAITLDSFKVYPNGCGGLDAAAAVRGFQAAVAVLDRVIVAEMQGGGSDTSSISTAADNAFDAGAVIIAANGNNGPGASTVNTPANAHKVIGVGDFDVQTLTQINGQSRGPAPDNRFKPDIQAPTQTETASSGSDTAFKTSFGGTSGATPYASGAAALLRNWLRGGSGSIDPGQVYAQMILSGQQPYPFNNTSGAGPLRLPTDGFGWWGKVSIGDGVTLDIPISMSGGSPNTFDGALWWPETATQAHNDIDLSLIDPSGTVRSSSISINSVFERARVSGSLASGTWILRVRGYSVSAGPQTVYWTAVQMFR